MAAITHAVATASTTNAESYTSGSFTPAAGDLLVALVTTTGSVEPVGLSDTQALGWTLVATANKSLTADSLYLYVASALAAASSTTVTFDCTGDEATGCTIQVMRVSGVTRTGSSAIRQFQTSSNNSAGTPSVTLAAAALTTNPTVGAVLHGDGAGAADPEPPTGFTDRNLAGYTTPTTGTVYCSDDSGFTGTTLTWATATSSDYCALAFEIDASSTGVSGSLSTTLGTLTLSGDGDVPRTGSLSSTLGDVGLTSDGDVPRTGSGSVTLGDLTGDGAGASALQAGWRSYLGWWFGGYGAVPALSGEGAATLAGATLSGAGAVALQGSGSATLGDATLSGDGDVPVAGAASATLGDVVLSGDGDVPRTGSLAATLAAAILSAAGTVETTSNEGDLAATLGDATLSAQGVAPVAGAASVALGAATLSGDGDVPRTGASSATLADATLAAEGTGQKVGILSSTLDACWAYGVGKAANTGTTTTTLGAATLSATGVVPMFGQGARTLSSCTIAATGVVGATAQTSAAWRWGAGDIEDYGSASLSPSTVLDDGTGDDTTTGEESTDVEDFAGDPSCAWRTVLAQGTAIGDLGSLGQPTAYRFTAWRTQDTGDDVECALPPEEEAPAGSDVARIYWSAGPTGPWTLVASHTLTGSATTFTGSFAGPPTARYIRLHLTSTFTLYDSSDTISATVRLSDVEITYWPGATLTTPEDAPILRSPGLVICEGARVSLYIPEAVAGATCYEVWRITDSEPLPGTRIWSGDQPTEEEPLIDAPRVIGETVLYRARGMNDDRTGPWSSYLVATPCHEDGTHGACACTWSPREPGDTEWTALERCREI